MSEVEFFENNEFHIRSRKLLGEPQTPSMIRLLLKSGLIKTEKQALVVLVAAIFLMFVATWFMFNSRGNSGESYVYDKYGKKYTIVEQLEAIKEGKRTFDDFR